MNEIIGRVYMCYLNRGEDFVITKKLRKTKGKEEGGVVCDMKL